MARCDLCRGECPAHKLEQLLSSYRAPGVVDICPSCARRLNKIKERLLLDIVPQMQAAVIELAGAGAAKRRWWQPRWLLKRKTT